MPGILGMDASDFIEGYRGGGLLGAFTGYKSPEMQAKLSALQMEADTKRLGQQAQQDLGSRYVEGTPWVNGDAPQYTGETMFGKKTGMEPSGLTRGLLAYAPAQSVPGLLQKTLPEEYQMQVGGQMAQGIGAPPMQQPGAQQPAPQQQGGGFALPQLAKAVEFVESRGNPNAVSPAGAVGPMQTMPATAANPGFGVASFNPNDAAANRQGGTEYLGAMVQKYGPQEGLMAYNWGPGNVDRWIAGGRNPNAVPAETQAYVQKVGQAMQQQGGGQPPQPAQAPQQQQQPNSFAAITQNPAIAPLANAAIARLRSGDIKGGLEMMTKVIENSPELQGQIAQRKGEGDASGRLIYDLAKSRGDAANKADYELEEVTRADGSKTKVPRSAFLTQPAANQMPPNAAAPAAGAPPGLTTDNGPSAKAQDEASGKFWGETNATLQKSAMDAQGKNNRLDRISSLLDGINTGTFATNKLALEKARLGVGLPVDAKTISKEEAAAALSNEIALSLRDPSSGGGMPGALSDSDRNFLQTMTPGLSTSPEGRKQIIDTAKKLNQRTVQVAKLARQYKQENNGRLNDGFVDKVEQYAAANPLFPQAPAATAGAPGAAPSGAPEGSKQIGTYQGKPVFQTPDGKRLVGE